jgi:hypothetical protein
LLALLRHRVLQRLLIGDIHPLVPLCGLGLEAFDHLGSAAVAGLVGIARIAGMGGRRQQADRDDRG